MKPDEAFWLLLSVVENAPGYRPDVRKQMIEALTTLARVACPEVLNP